MLSKDSNLKYIFVTGGVISGLGKGINTASIGLLLQNLGYNISVLKADMYLNIDAGTMNPLEHGEVFVTEDGLETDQDLGHYERFLNKNLGKHNYTTMGRVYHEVLSKERRLEYGGKCVQGHIHIPEEIIKEVNTAAKKDRAEIILIEVGGTVGEYQNVLFYESIRKLKQKKPNDVVLVHLVYLPVPRFLGEMKSKPAQSSIYELYKLGLQPDFVICRSNKDVDKKRRGTISINTGIKLSHIISAPDVDTIYKIPIILKEQNLDKKILQELSLKPKKKPNKNWEDFVNGIGKTKKDVKIAIMGKYFKSGNFSLEDSYVCVIEAIKHAAWSQGINPIIKWFSSEAMESVRNRKKTQETLSSFDGVIVPQGWGKRGTEGKINTIQFVRENKIPYLGLCFGMQMAVIEYARNVLGLKKASSEEMNKRTPYPVIHIMPNQKKYLEKNQYGGTIRLGGWPCKLQSKTILHKAYKKYSSRRINNKNTVVERHRHRYEFNNKYKKRFEKAGLIISGTSPDGKLVEAIELKKENHPFFVGTQFHPEYKSRPLDPHPIFMKFLEACGKN